MVLSFGKGHKHTKRRNLSEILLLFDTPLLTRGDGWPEIRFFMIRTRTSGGRKDQARTSVLSSVPDFAKWPALTFLITLSGLCMVSMLMRLYEELKRNWRNGEWTVLRRWQNAPSLSLSGQHADILLCQNVIYCSSDRSWWTRIPSSLEVLGMILFRTVYTENYWSWWVVTIFSLCLVSSMLALLSVILWLWLIRISIHSIQLSTDVNIYRKRFSVITIIIIPIIITIRSSPTWSLRQWLMIK